MYKIQKETYSLEEKNEYFDEIGNITDEYCKTYICSRTQIINISKAAHSKHRNRKKGFLKNSIRVGISCTLFLNTLRT